MPVLVAIGTYPRATIRCNGFLRGDVQDALIPEVVALNDILHVTFAKNLESQPRHTVRHTFNRSWGYTFSIFFDGNAFHEAGGSLLLSPPSLATNDTGCSEFSTTIDGVLTALENDTTAHGVTITDVAGGGFSLTHDASADEVGCVAAMVWQFQKFQDLFFVGTCCRS